MQFCRTCGSDLTAAAPPPGRAAAAAPVHAPAPSPAARASLPAIAPLPPTGAPPAMSGPPMCRRCGGQGDQSSRFCKFCGAPFDAPSTSAHPAVPAAKAQAEQAPTHVLPPSAATRGQVVIIQRDGSEGGVFPLDAPQTDLGSRDADIVLADDPYMAPRHARIERRGDSFILRDLATLNGIYARLREPVDLVNGDMFLIGQQVLRFEVLPEAERRVGPAKQHGVMVFGTPELPRLARVAQLTTEGLERDIYYLYRDETVFGREQADVVFAEDPFLSRRHAAIVMDRDQMRFTLRDLGSSNGSALRCRGERALRHGDQFRLGRHLFRFDLISVPDGRGGRGQG
jgi:pSer/pThr/pTyr-binding forkhead associated (FHA) protein